MYKKIFSGMKCVILFSLIISSLFVLIASYSFLKIYVNENLEKKAWLTAELLDSGKTFSELENTLPSGADILSPDGISRITGEKKNIEMHFAPGCYLAGIGYCVVLSNADILVYPNDPKHLTAVLIIGGITLTAVILLYFIAKAIASAITKSILRPLSDIYSYEKDSVYEELEPFIARIANQGKEIKRQEKKVKEQKTRLHVISENMNEGLIVVGKDNEILLVNKSVLDIFSAKEENIKHKDFSHLTADTLLAEHLKNALCGKKSYMSFETASKNYQVFFSPVYEKDEVKAAVIIMIDMSDKMKTEQIRREFTANVSHELKTPLTAIHGYSQIITEGFAKGDDVVRFASKIEQESMRMINLIDDIIKLSRLDEQTEAPTKEEVNLLELSREVAAELKSKADERNITVTVSGEDTVVLANKIQINEMIYNLCDNAIKYNVSGGKVDITVTENGFSVADTGIGIADEDKGRIFERFFRADKSHSKSVGGTGLGLSIVKHTAISNDALISVSSKTGVGTTFTVTFSR